MKIKDIAVVTMDPETRRRLLEGHKDHLLEEQQRIQDHVSSFVCPQCGSQSGELRVDTRRPFGNFLEDIKPGMELQHGRFHYLIRCCNCEACFEPDLKIQVSQGTAPKDAVATSKSLLWITNDSERRRRR